MSEGLISCAEVLFGLRIMFQAFLISFCKGLKLMMKMIKWFTMHASDILIIAVQGTASLASAELGPADICNAD